jgi:Fe-S-cluster containining protein
MKKIELPMITETPPASPVPCTECGKCCTYVAVGINAPTTPRTATDILWYLYHQGVSVYRDHDGEWAVMFDARCRHLQDDLLCSVYADRPHICRAFDNTGCEINAPGGMTVYRRPDEFLGYLKEKRPKVYDAVAKKYLPPALA